MSATDVDHSYAFEPASPLTPSKSLDATQVSFVIKTNFI